jgi:hypothetical protein
MRRTLVPMALAVLLAGGCGGESSTTDSTTGSTNVGSTISAEDYAHEADELCRRVATEVTELGIQEKGQEILSGPGTTEEKLNQIAELLDQQLQVVSDFRRDIEALGKPATSGEDVDEFLEKTGSAEDELARGIAAARDGDEGEFTDAMQRYAGLASQSASIARDSELNFAICGAGA